MTVVIDRTKPEAPKTGPVSAAAKARAKGLIPSIS